MGLTVHHEKHSCRRCGTDASGSKGGCKRRLPARPGAAQEPELHLCGPCACDLGSDERRDEYLRLGLLA
jgi:hypothetical protein